MKVKSSCVQSSVQAQQLSTPEELAMKQQMKKLEKKIAEIEQFEKCTKKEMQDRMKFMSGKNAVCNNQKLKHLEAEKEKLRQLLMVLQNPET